MADAVPTERLRLDDGPVEYLQIDGDPRRAPLVFLHEGLGSVGLWRGFPGDVARSTGRQALVYSRHGHGRSAVHRQPLTRDYLHHEATEVLPAVLAAAGCTTDPVLIGHSDGATIALIHAGTRTGTPAGLVLMAPHVTVEPAAIEGIRETVDAYRTTDLADRLARHHADADATFRRWADIWLDPDFASWDITDLLPGVTCPTLLVQGRDDQYATMHQLDLIQQGVRGPVTRLELADCRHAPHLDRPDAVLHAIEGFLDELAR